LRGEWKQKNKEQEKRRPNPSGHFPLQPIE